MAVLNVKDFGAAGDGVTNDTQAFLDALDILLNTFEKGVLYCPAGVYLITEQLEITKPFVSIKGDGINVTNLKFTGNGIQLSSYGDLSFAAIESLTISGPGVSSTPGYTTTGVFMPVSNYYFLEKFLITGFDIGIDGSSAVMNKFRDFSISGCKIGARFLNGSNATSMSNGNIRICYETGLEVIDAMSFFVSMLDIEAIGILNNTTGKYEGGVSIKTAAYINVRDCHFETSEVVLGINAGNCEVLFENSFIQYCANGVKQLDPVIVGRFDFVDLKFLAVDTEFDIPDLTKYRIKDCTARDGSGGWDTDILVNANPVKGTVQKDMPDPEFGRAITYRSGGMHINDRDVLTAYKFTGSIAVGTVPANSTVQFAVNSVTTGGVTVSEWGDVVQAAVISYTMPPGLLLQTCIQQYTNDTILVCLTNTTGTDINMGTQNFRFNIVSSYSGKQ